MATALREGSGLCRLNAIAVGPAASSRTAIASGDEALLQLAAHTLPTWVARAHTMHARAMHAINSAVLVLTPLASPSWLAHARADSRVARAVAVATVQATSHCPRGWQFRNTTVRSRTLRRIAFANAAEAAPAPMARWLPIRTHRA